jgi:hypothetical protein
MKENFLNNIIKEYNIYLEYHKLNLNHKKNLLQKFNKIIQFISEHKTYEFKKSSLSAESLSFLKERKINFKIEHIEYVEPLKLRIHDFINSDNLLFIQNILTQNPKNEQICKLREVIILIENDLCRVIDIEYKSLKKLTKSNLLFAKKKKQIFNNLVNHFKLNREEIIILLNEQNHSYKTINKLLVLMENELSDSEIKSYDFLRSIIPDRKERKKLRMAI